MGNKAQRVGSRGPYTTRRSEAECCMVPRDPTLSAHTAHTVRAITNLLCFSLVKHKSSAVYLIQHG